MIRALFNSRNDYKETLQPSTDTEMDEEEVLEQKRILRKERNKKYKEGKLKPRSRR